jgi:hypothetical protein
VKFKYSEKIKELGIINCPPNECDVVTDVGFYYRWVHENLNHKDNFIPVLEIKPDRITEPMFSKNVSKCSGFALSMHDSLENSRNHFFNVLNRVPNFFQIVGTHVAELKMNIDDGYVTVASQKLTDKGHFNFFEQKEINWIERVSNTYEIKNE